MADNEEAQVLQTEPELGSYEELQELAGEVVGSGDGESLPTDVDTPTADADGESPDSATTTAVEEEEVEEVDIDEALATDAEEQVVVGHLNTLANIDKKLKEIRIPTKEEWENLSLEDRAYVRARVATTQETLNQQKEEVYNLIADARLKVFEKKAELYEKMNAGFSDRIKSPVIPIGQEAVQAILDSDIAPAILDLVATNASVAKRLIKAQQLGKLEREVVALEVQVRSMDHRAPKKAVVEAPAVAPKKESKRVTTPSAKQGGRNSAKDPASMTMDEYRAYRASQK